MVKVGKFTAAALFIAVGVLLLLEQAGYIKAIPFIMNGWPIILILLGLEFVVISLFNRKKDKKLSLAWGSLPLSLLTLVVVLAVMGSSSLPLQFLQNEKTEKPVIQLELPENTQLTDVQLENQSGQITITSGDVEHIEAKLTVYVSGMLDDQKIQELVDQTYLDIDIGQTLVIKPILPEYRTFIFTQKPRVDISLTIPAELVANWEVINKNGQVSIQGINILEKLDIETSNGKIYVKDLVGEVKASTSNGAIELIRIEGNVIADSSNGKITLKTIHGNAVVETSNGAVYAKAVRGELDIHTSNGGIEILEAQSMINATTSNGKIKVMDSEIAGDWELETSNGNIEIELPHHADASIHAHTKGGKNISADLPLEVIGHDIKGVLGKGTYRIELATNNSIDIK
jgi:DUF4097 and DUF4098 domain-containing protein YvlB